MSASTWSRAPRRLLRRSQPRAADLAHGALLLGARRARLPEALELDPRVARGCAPPRARRRHARARRRAGGACAKCRAPDGRQADEPMSKGPEALVRDEVRALKAYRVEPSKGLVKLDA